MLAWRTLAFVSLPAHKMILNIFSPWSVWSPCHKLLSSVYEGRVQCLQSGAPDLWRSVSPQFLAPVERLSVVIRKDIK